LYGPSSCLCIQLCRYFFEDFQAFLQKALNNVLRDFKAYNGFFWRWCRPSEFHWFCSKESGFLSSKGWSCWKRNWDLTTIKFTNHGYKAVLAEENGKAWDCIIGASTWQRSMWRCDALTSSFHLRYKILEENPVPRDIKMSSSLYYEETQKLENHVTVFSYNSRKRKF
jgi:hypothetical protein